MSRLEWSPLPWLYDSGVSNGVLYLDEVGVAWNGLTSVTENATGSQETSHYFDGRRLIITEEVGDYEASVQAMTYPDGFEEYNGYSESQAYKRFEFSYRSQHGENDRIHLVYNALIRPPDPSWASIKESLDTSLFTWDIQASAIHIPGARPASHLVIDTAFARPELVEMLENYIYGSSSSYPMLPPVDELVDIFEASMTLRIIYNGDGSYTAIGPDVNVPPEVDGTFDILAPTAHFLDQDSFTVRSF